MDALIAIVKFISRISPIIPLLLFVYQNNFKNKAINLLALLLIISLLSDLAIYILAQSSKSGSLIANIFFMFQFVLASLIYYHIYIKKGNSKFKVLIAVGLVFILINWLFVQKIGHIQNLAWAVTSILIATMAFGHFSYLIRFPVIHIKKHAPYWISTGLLFYCCLSFLLFGFTKALAEQLDTSDFELVWMFHNLNNIFKNGCFLMAIWWAVHRNPQWDVADVHEN